jgi:hypothetical protein
MDNKDNVDKTPTDQSRRWQRVENLSTGEIFDGPTEAAHAIDEYSGGSGVCRAAKTGKPYKGFYFRRVD